MRLIGGKDYYDSGLAYGRDEQIVFVRSSPLEFTRENLNFDLYMKISPVELIPFKNGQAVSRDNHYSFSLNGNRFKLHVFNIIVAGKLYGGVRLLKADILFNSKPTFFWSFAYLKKFFDQIGFEFATQKHYSIKYYTEEEMREHFEKTELSSNFINLLVEQRITTLIPTFDKTYKENEVIAIANNDQLKTVEFQKRLNAYQCFQEISMWVGGVLPRNPNPMVTITDNKVKIHKAGFDPKTSFRNMRRAS